MTPTDPTPLGDAGSAEPRVDVELSDERLAAMVVEYDAAATEHYGYPEQQNEFRETAAALRELQRLRADRTPAPAQPMTGAPGTSTPAQREAFIVRGNVTPAQPDAAAGDVAALSLALTHAIAGWRRSAYHYAEVAPTSKNPQAHVSVAAALRNRADEVECLLARLSPAPQTVPPQGAPEASVEALERIAKETAERIGDEAFREVTWEAEYLPTEAAVIILAALQRAQTGSPTP